MSKWMVSRWVVGVLGLALALGLVQGMGVGQAVSAGAAEPNAADSAKSNAGSLRWARTRPPIKIVLISDSGQTVTINTRRSGTRKVPTGRYSVSVINPRGFVAKVNSGKKILEVKRGKRTNLPVQITKLALLRLESVTSNGVTTTAVIRSAKKVSVSAQALDATGAVTEERAVVVSGPKSPQSVRFSGDVALVRVRVIGSRLERSWEVAAPQRGSLDTATPAVNVRPDSVKVTAPVSATEVAVTRIAVEGPANRSSHPTVLPVPFNLEDGMLEIRDSGVSPGAYEYQIRGRNRAGESVLTTLGIGVPDASGNGLAVWAPNTRELTVGAIERDTSTRGLASISLNDLPLGAVPEDYLGNPIVASTIDKTVAVVGKVVSAVNGRLQIRETSLRSVVHKANIRSFGTSLPRRTTRFLSDDSTLMSNDAGPRAIRPRCERDGVETSAPNFAVTFEGPSTEAGQWDFWTDGADAHLRGGGHVGALVEFAGFEITTGVSCYLDDLPMLATLNVEIPAGPIVIPTVLTAKPYVQLSAQVGAEFGVYAHRIDAEINFEISDGWNGLKLHSGNPISLSSEPAAQLEPLVPSAAITAGMGLDIAYGLGAGIKTLGLQVAGLSIKVGPELQLKFSSGKAVNEPESGACLTYSASLARVSVEAHLAEGWFASQNWSGGDVTLFQLPGIGEAEGNLLCWGDASDAPLVGSIEIGGPPARIQWPELHRSVRVAIVNVSQGKRFIISGVGPASALRLFDSSGHEVSQSHTFMDDPYDSIELTALANNSGTYYLQVEPRSVNPDSSRTLYATLGVTGAEPQPLINDLGDQTYQARHEGQAFLVPVEGVRPGEWFMVSGSGQVKGFSLIDSNGELLPGHWGMRNGPEDSFASKWFVDQSRPVGKYYLIISTEGNLLSEDGLARFTLGANGPSAVRAAVNGQEVTVNAARTGQGFMVPVDGLEFGQTLRISISGSPWFTASLWAGNGVYVAGLGEQFSETHVLTAEIGLNHDIDSYFLQIEPWGVEPASYAIRITESSP